MFYGFTENINCHVLLFLLLYMNFHQLLDKIFKDILIVMCYGFKENIN